MDNWYTPPDQVAPLFDLGTIHPFLLRPLNDLERLVVRDWIKYYKKRHSRGYEQIPSWQYQKKFPDHMVKNHFSPELLDTRFQPESALFQNLFFYKPRIQLMSALRRITGFMIKPTLPERNAAFKEVVELHRSQYGSLPKWADFRSYHNDRFFLPRTGILTPSVETFEVSNRPEDMSSLRWVYETVYKDSGEFSRDELDHAISGRNYSDDDLVQNYRKVYDHLCAKYPSNVRRQIPTPFDVDEFAKIYGGISWFHYRRWITLSNTANNSDNHRSLKWLRQQCGIPLERARNYNIPSQRWNDKMLRDAVQKLWEQINPQGFVPEEAILVDPPTAQEIDRSAKLQSEIWEDYGALDPIICQELGVPDVWIPYMSVIKRRYSMIEDTNTSRNGAYQKLLRDIEDSIDGEISFSRVRQLVALKRFARENDLEAENVPRVVARHLVELQQLPR